MRIDILINLAKIIFENSEEEKKDARKKLQDLDPEVWGE